MMSIEFRMSVVRELGLVDVGAYVRHPAGAGLAGAATCHSLSSLPDTIRLVVSIKYLME